MVFQESFNRGHFDFRVSKNVLPLNSLSSEKFFRSELLKINDQDTKNFSFLEANFHFTKKSVIFLV